MTHLGGGLAPPCFLPYFFVEETTRTLSKSQAYPATGDRNQHEKLSPLLLRLVANIFTKRSKINGIIVWIMTTNFSELTPRQTRRVPLFAEPMLLTRSSPQADWRDAKLRGKTSFVVRHFVTLMAGTARACSVVFETCHSVESVFWLWPLTDVVIAAHCLRTVSYTDSSSCNMTLRPVSTWPSESCSVVNVWVHAGSKHE